MQERIWDEGEERFTALCVVRAQALGAEVPIHSLPDLGQVTYPLCAFICKTEVMMTIPAS